MITTHPTKDIYNYVLQDFIRITNGGEIVILFDDRDLSDSMDDIISIKYHEELEIDGIKIRVYNTGHVLGAAMLSVEIGGVLTLYWKLFLEENRHL